MTPDDSIHYDEKTHQLIIKGEWDINHLSELQPTLEQLKPPKEQFKVNGKDIEKLDSAGAWLLITWQEQQNKNNSKPEFINFSEQHLKLISIVQEELTDEAPLPEIKPKTYLEKVGIGTVNQLSEFTAYLNFIGQLAYESLRVFSGPVRIRWNALTSVIYTTGFQALPIITLLSFMIGVVITFQMGLQLRSYGANIYIVDLLGLSILREFGPLITAIMIAGRTGSAFTAELGMMKLNQEIDALNTMGVTPAELLLIPRILGLIIALPLLTIWADIFGVFGGMVMANNMLSITWYDFLHRFPQVIPLRALLIGLGKAPVFAFIISTVGCFQGMRVEETADSVGRNTTRSVVLAIFFIIVADAGFSIIFSKLKL